jgi:two-component system cell cycle response regulator DivK
MGNRVLIIEDEPKNLKLFSDLLKRFGYETMEAIDGEQGIEFAKARTPDLILMDIMMPKIDGLEATRILKADPITKHIPIMALTSYAMKGDRERTLEAGCNSYIAKPVDIQELLRAVELYIGKGSISVS